jgi:cellulose synthase/poly-beta-1,6-N-acetylglucosamine synthase-like glycosyltransferase
VPAAGTDGNPLSNPRLADSEHPKRLRPALGTDRTYPVDVVILARDEETILHRTISNLLPLLQPGDRLNVVADHCRDQTALVAKQLGATVYRRSGGLAGKGRALGWWLERTRDFQPRAGVIVFDADSRTSSPALQALRSRLRAGQQAIQSRVIPVVTGTNPIPVLAALSEEVEQAVFDVARQQLGWPVRLRGTGMAFDRRVLSACASDLASSVEDAELSWLLFASGVRIHAAPESAVFDPKPADAEAAVRQRARWLQGQVDLARSRPMLVGKLLTQGPAGWSLLSTILLKPRSLLVPLKLLLAASGLAWLGLAQAGPAPWLLMAPLAMDLVALALGLWIVPPHRRLRYLAALLHTPIFFGVWVRSLLLARISTDPWLRSRTGALEGTLGESSTASV